MLSHYLDKLSDLLKTSMTALKGRPVALVILLWLSLGSLVSEWPMIDKPVIVGLLERVTSGPFKAGQKFLFDSYQSRMPRIPESQPVTVVAIDEKSLAEMGQWPWPRNRMADLIDKINAMKPLAVGLDIYMPEPDQTSPDKVAANLPAGSQVLADGLRALPSHETLLAKSLKAAPTILGAAGFDHAAMTTADRLLTAPIQTQGSDPRKFVQHFDQVLASLPQLQEAAHGQALLSVALEQGVVRRLPLVMGLGDTLVPGLAMEMLRVATQSEAIVVHSDDRGIKQVGLADLVVPTQAHGEIWLHFAKAKSTSDRYVSALDIMNGKADPERFKDKLILLGLTGAGLNDMRTTALGELVPGIEIQAQVIEAIFDGKFLVRPFWLKWTETVFLLIFGLILIWYVPRTESRLAKFLDKVPGAKAAIGMSLNGLIFATGFLSFRYYGLLVDAASIFIVSSATLSSLIASAKMVMSNQKKAELKQEQKFKEAAAYEAGLQEGLSKAPSTATPSAAEVQATALQ